MQIGDKSQNITKQKKHNQKFKNILSSVMPDWGKRRNLLDRSPLAYEDWDY